MKLILLKCTKPWTYSCHRTQNNWPSKLEIVPLAHFLDTCNNHVKGRYCNQAWIQSCIQYTYCIETLASSSFLKSSPSVKNLGSRTHSFPFWIHPIWSEGLLGDRVVGGFEKAHCNPMLEKSKRKMRGLRNENVSLRIYWKLWNWNCHDWVLQWTEERLNNSSVQLRRRISGTRVAETVWFLLALASLMLPHC